MKKDITYWYKNAQEDYITTPISVLRYINELEKESEKPQWGYVVLGFILGCIISGAIVYLDTYVI